jgi:L-ribulokinase
MQIYADVTGYPLHLIGSEQGPALGSAMHAAVAAGAYPDIHAAAEAMGRVRRDVYTPDPQRGEAYDALYEHYSRLHDHFGRGGDDVMHELRRLRPREVARD